MFSRFFINRPVFASVISLLIFIAGVVTAVQLPVAQFPDIVPPVVSVSATYPGADPQTLAETVAVLIEQQVNGVDDMIYMNSTCASDGSYTLSVYFEIGTNPDMNTVNVNNRVAIAAPRLPPEVQATGVTVKKKSTNILGFYSFSLNAKAGPTKTEEYLANYVSINVRDLLARIEGVGDAQVMDPKDYSIRVWLNPALMGERNISVQEIVKIIEEQNVQVAAGSVGAEPVPAGQLQAITITTKGRLADASEFAEMVVRRSENGEILKLKDIARIELGRQMYTKGSFNSIFPPSEHDKKELERKNPGLKGVVMEDTYREAATVAVYLMPGANAVHVANAVNAELAALKPDLDRAGIDYVCAYDSTVFIRVSLEEVVFTLFFTIAIVIVVVYVFLQDWRACLIPSVAIPVSLVGTFFLMGMFGFSINTLTLLGLILVIGIVVDDAIVVVENCTRLIDDEKLSPIDAAIKSMTQVSGPIIATTCVLMSVFLPTTFISGMVGVLYQQFALTIAASVVLSAICALTLSPALCAIFLRPSKPEEKKFVFFRMYNKGFNGFAWGYEHALKFLLRHAYVIIAFWIFLIVAVTFGMKYMKQGFVPNEDQGVVFLDIRLPDGRSLQETNEVCRKVNAILEHDFNDVIDNVHMVTGYSMLDQTSATNLAIGVLRLREWKQRKAPQMEAQMIANRMMGLINQEIPECLLFAFVPPPITGVGTSGGLEGQLIDKSESGVLALYEASQTLSDEGVKSGGFTRVFSTFNPHYPQYYLDVNRDKAKKMGIDLDEVNASLQAYLGSTYVNDFNAYGRVFQVNLQAEGRFRTHYLDILQLPVMNLQGEKVPLSAIARVQDRVAPASVTRFNLYTTTLMTANIAPGESTGTGMAKLQELTDTNLPETFAVQWTGMAFQQSRAGMAIAVIFVLSLIFAFLVLAAQYESWSAPIIIMMAVPLGVSGAMLAVYIAGLDINLYTQVGFIVMVGLSAKNAILITEYARDSHLKDGMPITESAQVAGRMRLRPIMMTSYAFILGVIPLVIATGAGANSRRAIGTAVFGGMFEETMIGILVTPVLFMLITNMGEASMKVIRRWIGVPEQPPVAVYAAEAAGKTAEALGKVAEAAGKAAEAAAKALEDAEKQAESNVEFDPEIRRGEGHGL